MLPGAPPTFAVQTDPATMGQFGSPQIKPKKSNITLRRNKGVSFGSGGSQGGSSGQEDNQQGGGPSLVVTVFKMG